MRGADWAALALLVTVAGALWSFERGVPNDWGDDWAGYLLQARAIATGTVAEEFATNAAVIDGTDAQIGPYAYPWGYPLLLAAIGPWVHWDPLRLTLAGGAALAVLTAASYTLVRQFLPLRPALLCTGLAVVQVPMLLASLQLVSDVPFAALAMTALALAVRAYHTLDSGASVSLPFTCALAFIAAGAFSVRSNGAILIASHAALIATIGFEPDRRRAALTHFALFTGLTSLFVAVYFAVWPDGSLGHARLLVFDPRLWPPRLAAHGHNLATFFPFDAMRGQAKLAVFGAALVLALVGAGTAARRAAPLTLYIAGHLSLLTLFPYDQGGRYYLPVLAPLGVLIALGTARGWRAVTAAWPIHRTVSNVVTCGMTVTCLGATAFAAARELPRRLEVLRSGTGPFSPATGTLTRYLQALPPGRRIAYRKPRALRYLSGRPAVAITHASHLDTVDLYVFDMEHADEQVPEAALAEGDRFVLLREQWPYRVYERRTARAPAR